MKSTVSRTISANADIGGPLLGPEPQTASANLEKKIPASKVAVPMRMPITPSKIPAFLISSPSLPPQSYSGWQSPGNHTPMRSDSQDGDAPVHPADECLFKKAGKLGTQRCPVFHALQFLQHPPDVASHASDGGGNQRPRLDNGGNRGSFALIFGVLGGILPQPESDPCGNSFIWFLLG